MTSGLIRGSGASVGRDELIGKVPEEEITANGPKLHDYLQEMHRETFGDPGTF